MIVFHDQAILLIHFGIAPTVRMFYSKAKEPFVQIDPVPHATFIFINIEGIDLGACKMANRSQE